MERRFLKWEKNLRVVQLPWVQLSRYAKALRLVYCLKVKVASYKFFGEQGWRSGESARLECGPGSTPDVDAICGLSLLLVLSIAPRGFSPGTPVFTLGTRGFFSRAKGNFVSSAVG